jgi:ketosteroid isomerase-like protein
VSSVNEPSGAARVHEVFAHVRNGDSGVADLYADDGVILVGGKRIEGREEIRAFYARTIAARHPQPRVEVVLESEGSGFYAVVVEVPTGTGHIHALDLFTIGEDGIRQLEIFHREID